MPAILLCCPLHDLLLRGWIVGQMESWPVSAQSPINSGHPVPSVLILIAFSTSKRCCEFRNNQTNPEHRIQILKSQYCSSGTPRLAAVSKSSEVSVSDGVNCSSASSRSKGRGGNCPMTVENGHGNSSRPPVGFAGRRGESGVTDQIPDPRVALDMA